MKNFLGCYDPRFIRPAHEAGKKKHVKFWAHQPFLILIFLYLRIY